MEAQKDIKPSILFATPCYGPMGGMVTAQYFGSCLNLREELLKVGLEHDWLIGNRDSLLARCRNEMTFSFLQTEFSHMMWIDADIEFSPADVAALWNLQTDVAVGVYAMKRPDKQWYGAWINGVLVKDLDQFEGPIEVDYAGTGFMLIKRNVIETLAKSVPNYEGPDGRVAAIYNTPVHNDMFESEDYNFCRIAREAGFKIIMEPGVRLGHIGQYTYGSKSNGRE